jgi:outer membrane protein OmpA-like peptidoglycan-associated protein
MELIQPLLREGFTAINIAGHTDSIGKPASNLRRSNPRAKTVSDSISGNIDSEVNAIGESKAKPFKSNVTKVGRAANRGVETYVK